ncbi:response regulator transcription factor [Neobacillus cucumis]|uniref:response regulator transcription factor n=1 Tax=Neobacillus cucumis TaxID=1740721 RepID=UPI002852F7FE|nr:response regulator transcription factor [Neobacillus cucumis]MDR4945341.1 response regulator transcription factor [Neobacillus cucumis]
MKIVLIDDHPLFRSGVRNLIQTTEDLEVIGEGASGEEAVELALQLQPDVIVMDIRMPGLNGIEATRVIREKLPEMKILIVTMLKNDKSVFTAMQMGARGYVLKDAGEMELLHSIRMVGNGGAVFSSDIAVRMVNYFTMPQKKDLVNPALSELTSRELEVLELIAEGNTNTQIGAKLQLSTKTVANHISNILNKLQVTDRHQAKKVYKESQNLLGEEDD